jgi:uncharacterized iron-regulated membrane protein
MTATGRTRSWRVVVRRIHLWLGLSLGLLFAVAGLTGSALVFYPEIDNALVPGLRAVPTGARPVSWQAVVDRLRHDHSDRTGPWRIEVTPAGGPIPVRYYKPAETSGQVFAPLMLWLDPRDLRTVRAGFWGEYPTTWLYRLHWQLLSGTTGEVIMGVAGILMLGMLGTGVVAWWPRIGQWRRASRWKPGAGPVRRLYDLHKLVGLGSVVVLIVVTATGALLELPDQVRPVVARASPLFTMPTFATPAASGATLSVDTLVALARKRFPHAELAWIETPGRVSGAIRVNLWQPGEPSRRFPHTNVWLDPHGGAVLAIRDGRRESAGDVALDWLHPLHGGEALGLVGRVLVLLSGLAATMLAVTGWARWLVRRDGRQSRVRTGS